MKAKILKGLLAVVAVILLSSGISAAKAANSSDDYYYYQGDNSSSGNSYYGNSYYGPSFPPNFYLPYQHLIAQDPRFFNNLDSYFLDPFYYLKFDDNYYEKHQLEYYIRRGYLPYIPVQSYYPSAY